MEGVTTPEREPCHYGVTRENCHIGCGIQCRPARAAAKRQFTASPSVAADHPNCGSPSCCGDCHPRFGC